MQKMVSSKLLLHKTITEGMTAASLKLLMDSSAAKDMNLPKHNYKPSRKPRHLFTNEQLSRLEEKFLQKRYLTIPERLELSVSLKITDTQTKVLSSCPFGSKKNRVFRFELLSFHLSLW